ncbi:MAG: hypothetical protein JW809_16145 [Pirellulales bacterium]|nr:hypothetical protein [Pirellulales bacterium]
MDRRRFIQMAGASTAALGGLGVPRAAAAQDAPPPELPGHYVPADKGLKPEWIAEIAARGAPAVHRGKDLETIGMPIGGIGAGQLYLVGDGRLMGWEIFNQHNFSGWGAENYNKVRAGTSPVAQGFAVRVVADGKTTIKTLDCDGFPEVTFRGEYPIGLIDYVDAELPVSIKLEAFSPFIPLAAAKSALPATVMEFTVKNTSDATVEVTLAGWLGNAVSAFSASELLGTRTNEVVDRDGLTMVLGTAQGIEPETPDREPRVLADFEDDGYKDWTAEGDAIGKGPTQGTLPGQQNVTGFQGKGMVNTFLGGDNAHGKLTSPRFTIDRSFISFLIGGGNQPNRACINLLVDGKKMRTATGRDAERLAWQSWDVRDLAGKEAKIEIVDAASGPWGHVNVDQIEMGDRPRSGRKGKLEDQEDFGSMGLAVLAGPGTTLASAALPAGKPGEVLFANGGLAQGGKATVPLVEDALVGAVGRKLSLEPGEEAKVPFVVTWCFPKRPDRGKKNFYANRFQTAQDVAEYVQDNLEPLSRDTRLWRDTWYDSTLPWWLLDRLFSTNSYLATGTCHWWGNGRFWAWEGVGCCAGTCAHVWNYEHGMARLFPRLERSVREMQDFNPKAGFVADTGEIHFRGESNDFWAGDSQGGTILKSLREHRMSADDEFLKRNWPHVRKALEFLIREDKDDNGLLEGSQHNTYDINFQGPNTMVGSLYLGALRAAEEMARELGDEDFAKKCHELWDRGSKASMERLFNGEYFIQEVDLAKHPKHQYGIGCLSDQLFGQGWAHQVGLGYIYPKDAVLKALASIWKYNWAPDVGPQNEHFKPQRWFAMPGEPGLFTCTWPKGQRMPEPVLYKNEVWTGIEYQVAGHMAWEGMVDEALVICRGAHERYHPSKRNPYNEVECGDHYARALASHGVFLGLCGFECHGPKRHLGFAPRITPDDFRAAFTTAEGWGTISQKRAAGKQTNRVEVRWGKVPLATLAFELPEDAKLSEATIALGGGALNVSAKQDGRRVTLALAEPIVVEPGQSVEVTLTC